MKLRFLILFRTMLCCPFFSLSLGKDNLNPGECLHNNETLVSAGNVLELGFFTSRDGTDHFLGIWFIKDEAKKPVWVANRDSPLIDSSEVLQFRQDGNLEISDVRMIPFIVNYGSLATNNNTRVIILDTGNLILVQGKVVVWQSFDYPTDTFLPGMKLGLFNFHSNRTRKLCLQSWLSPLIPTNGAYVLGVDPRNLSRFNLWLRNDSQEIGFWDGRRFRFFFRSSLDNLNFSFVSNYKEVYLTFNNEGNTKTYSWFVLASTGDINEFTLTEKGMSVVNHSLCNGLSAAKSNDCFIQVPLRCKNGSEFSGIKGSIPESMVLSGSASLGLTDCEMMCRRNCSCTAFASADDYEIGCKLYYGDTEDLVNSIGEGNKTTYIRGGASSKSGDQSMGWLRWVIGVALVSVLLCVVVALSCLLRRKWKSPGICGAIRAFQSRHDDTGTDDIAAASGLELVTMTDLEIPALSFSSVAAATGNFSAENKIAEGGFGPVYKGRLSGQEVAVKRLSKTSGQGLEEFKNEVELISKLQHRNLVKLLGCCIEQGEKILIYEYMPNRSLDSFIFDPVKRKLLDWMNRLRIIEGIAKGLLYLHEFSRLRVIHRDLKSSNILLDDQMMPKISDFGLARIFSDNESRRKTKTVAGTFGYMSPEYGVDGVFSPKSDMYSFGVILLEIVSGERNSSFYDANRSLNLLGRAWKLWEEGRCMEFMDPVLVNPLSVRELSLCIHIALLCVQDQAEDRPTISDIISMLNNEGAVLPIPKKPTLFAAQVC